jgi:DNA-binding IclR family transcriptional regulator
MRNGTPILSATSRALDMLEAVIADGGASSVSTLARAVGCPVATAHRQVATLVAQGFLITVSHGRHIAGPRLRSLIARVDDKQMIANVAAPLLHRLAAATRAVVQLGTFENDMVTYRIKTGQGAHDLFTQVDMQLEAYCSGIGKVLLAHLPASEREAYLAGGPFVALTAQTITDPAALAGELARVAQQGFAEDRGEIDPDVFCLAVPIRRPDGSVPAAISASRLKSATHVRFETLQTSLRTTADAIEQAAFGPR